MPFPSQSKQPQSMADGLQKLLGDVAQMMAAPDADMQFLSGLQAAIVQQIRNAPGLQDPKQQQMMAMQAQMGGPGGGPGGPGGLPAGAAAAGPPGPAAMGGGMPGLTPTAPNMDEIRRMLGAQGATQ